MIWLRKYPTFSELANKFGIPITSVHRIIHKLLPIIHVVTVPKYIKWHSAREWNDLTGSIEEWPNVVGILDGTPFRISRPAGDSNTIDYGFDQVKTCTNHAYPSNTLKIDIFREISKNILQERQALFFPKLDSNN